MPRVAKYSFTRTNLSLLHMRRDVNVYSTGYLLSSERTTAQRIIQTRASRVLWISICKECSLDSDFSSKPDSPAQRCTCWRGVWASATANGTRKGTLGNAWFSSSLAASSRVHLNLSSFVVSCVSVQQGMARWTLRSSWQYWGPNFCLLTIGKASWATPLTTSSGRSETPLPSSSSSLPLFLVRQCPQAHTYCLLWSITHQKCSLVLLRGEWEQLGMMCVCVCF